MAIDVSVVLNVHREQNLLLPTLYSLRDAAAYARNLGLRIELVCVFDCADEPTRRAYHKVALPSFDEIVVLETSHASLPLARTSGCAAARGKYIGLCDGDDLISFNLFSAMYFEAERSGPATVLFPEWLLSFGEQSYFARYADLRHMTPFSFMDVNPYISRSFFHRNVLEHVAFSYVGISNSYAYEDWHFNCEMVANRMDLRIAPDTILFYRERDGLLARSNRESVQTIAPSRLFDPKTFIEVCDRREASNPGLSTCGDPSLDFISGPICRLLVNAANKIEPQIEHRQFVHSQEYPARTISNLKIGRAYLEICRSLDKDRFGHVFILPWIAKGGAELYFNNLIKALHQLEHDEPILVLTGEPGSARELVDQISPCSTVLDLSSLLGAIGEAGIDLITLKLLQSCAPDAIVHLRTSFFAFRFFRRYGRALRQNKHVSYHFGNDVYLDGEFQVRTRSAPSFIAEQERHIDLFVTDSSACVDRLQSGMLNDKWFILPTLRNPRLSREAALARASTKAKRILWASRLAREKRPELLPTIAERLKNALPDYVIEVWGETDPAFDHRLIEGGDNLRSMGPYESFDDIAAGDYMCFLYTSLTDGVPNVLLEAAANGLPIIAPDVGGVGSFVRQRETGVLLPSSPFDPEMADAYVNALMELDRDSELRTRLASNAFDRVVREHSTAAYNESVTRLLEAVGERRAA